MRAYTITDAGKVRSENQDCVRFTQSLLPGYGIIVLCDGMGGAQAGSVASEKALSAFTEKLSELIEEKKSRIKLTDLVRRAAAYANDLVYASACENEAYSGMGTTLVAAVIRGRQCVVANIGDSRAYLIADGTIKQITVDHSFVADMVKRGSITSEQARSHPRRNVITRALGTEPVVECDIFTPSFRKNNILLLCSDGLSNTLTDEEILYTVTHNKGLEAAGQELLELALSRGAPDNVTVGLLQK